MNWETIDLQGEKIPCYSGKPMPTVFSSLCPVDDDTRTIEEFQHRDGRMARSVRGGRSGSGTGYITSVWRVAYPGDDACQGCVGFYSLLRQERVGKKWEPASLLHACTDPLFYPPSIRDMCNGCLQRLQEEAEELAKEHMKTARVYRDELVRRGV